MTWLVIAATALAWASLTAVGVREGHKRWEIHKENVAARSIEATHNRIAQLEIELGITAPLYARPEQVEQAWQLRWDAQLGPGPPPRGMSRGMTAEEQAAVEQTRARRKAVARAAAQKREVRRGDY